MTSPSRRFLTPPMDGPVLAITIVVLALPVGLLVFAAALPQPALLVPGTLTIALCVWVGLRMRPSWVELSPARLRIQWPARSEEIHRHRVAAARVLDRRGVRAELGLALRIGVGGLFGGFGWLWSTRRGIVRFYVTRTDEFAFIELVDGRPLLLTVDDPAAFVAAFQEGR